jgi:hypothetical protein
MPLSRFLRTFSQPADSDLDDAGGNTSDDTSSRDWQASGSKATTHHHIHHHIHRPWRAKGQLTTDHSSPSQSRPIPPPTFPTPYPAIRGEHLNSPAASLEIRAIDAVPDKFVEAWDAVKDGPKSADTSRALPKRGHSATLAVGKVVGVSAAPSFLFFHALIRDKRIYLLRLKLVLHRSYPSSRQLPRLLNRLV